MILVIGGTGVVGRRVVESLISAKTPVRVFSAGLSDWREILTPAFRKAGIEVYDGDVRDQHALAAAVSGCTGIIHAAGIMHPKPDQSLQSVNFQSLASLLPIAENAGVQRFVYISCLGASQFNISEYFRTKYEAEALVRESKFAWTIFRPALIFDENAILIRALEFWVRRFPVVLTVGSGLNEIAVISAQDVAECVVQSIFNRQTAGQCYDLAGPRKMRLTELMELICQAATGRNKPVLKIPATLGYRLAELLSKLNPRCPISGEFMRVLTADLTADPSIMQSNFKVPALPLESLYEPALQHSR